MIDRYGRKIEYLRLSVTDLCNFRCIYCMGENGIEKRSHGDILSIEELARIAKAAYALDIRKIRLTGGEPLVRRGLTALCENIKALGNDIELSLTTNGSLLPAMAGELKAAGVDRLNISLDTLDEKKFRTVTRCGELRDVLRGIQAAEYAGFHMIKLNTVLIGGMNDDEVEKLIRLTKDHEISLRFIELMPLGVAAGWDKDRFISAQVVENYLQNAELIAYDGVARLYRPQGYRGTVGLISPMSNSFCDRCNRIRVTADGRLKPCLHSSDEISIKGLSDEELIQAMTDGISRKPQGHSLNVTGSSTSRSMNEIGG